MYIIGAIVLLTAGILIWYFATKNPSKATQLEQDVESDVNQIKKDI